MAKNIMRLTESELYNIVSQISEGLIKSYNIDTCKSYMQKKFPNIRRIVSLKNNPYMEHGQIKKAKHNDFVGIVLDCNNFDNYMEIIETANNLLGWFTGHIELRQQVKGGYIPYTFYNLNGRFYWVNGRGGGMYLHDYLKHNPKLSFFSIIIEAKFGEIYHQKPNEVFYHATDKSVLHKILTKGLVPKSQGNFPERIYLGKSLSEIKDMVEGNLNDMVILKVDVSNVRLFKLYRDQRNSTAVFTYDNIPPSQIEIFDTYT